MEVLAFIVNLIGLLLCISVSLLKGDKVKLNLLLLLLGNLLVAVAYLIAGTGISGAASGILACAQIAINYIFESKKRPIPKWLIGIYAVSFIVINLVLGGFEIATLFAILACMAFIASIAQKNGKKYRTCAIINTVFWCIYDVITLSYNGLITHCSILVVNLIGVFIHDVKKKKTK